MIRHWPLFVLLATVFFVPSLFAQEPGAFISPIANPAEPGNLLRFPGDSQMDFGLALPLWMYGVDSNNSSWEVAFCNHE